MKEVTRIFDILDRLMELCPNKDDIFARKCDGKWEKYSVKEYVEISHALAYAFLALDLKPHDKIVTVTNNRAEWNFMDMGAALAGMIHVPVYPILSLENYQYIIPHSDAKLVLVGNDSIYQRVAPVVYDNISENALLYTANPIEGEKTFADLLELGRKNKSRFEATVEQNKKNISQHDVATIIYTSGTTGLPKGVMLSHRNLIQNFKGHAAMQIRDVSHRMLSFLPLCHIYERSLNYEYQFLGVSTYYAENIGTIAVDLKDSHADGFCAVPRVMEMMYDKLRAVGKDLKGLKRTIYEWAFDLAEKFDYQNTNFWYKLKNKIADILVYSKWRDNLGGHEMLIVSGGSSIQERIIRLFTAAKMYIFEGYGLTETSPVIAVNNPKEMLIKIGTVGKVLKSAGVEVKLAEDGEILTKGDCLMKGYYKDPHYTAEVIDAEGWFHTGDIGEFVEGDFLKITDRKKEIFKLSGGKYIAPQLIENIFKASPLIENLMVVGANEKYASAVIIPNFTYLKYWAIKHNMPQLDNEQLVQNEQVIARVQREIDQINATLSPHEQLKRVKIIADEWSIQTGELSPTLKLRRKIIYEKYDKLFRQIYGYSEGDAAK
ncbi:MAG: long-chain fatty acid--CoA ligase [Bacteroidales bacterium]|jgi:long-chain acyl-CoA synthetase|nr:long-chain fatty acid--CoA ligase [Bacteroidales bacterium]